jgi:biotin carboxylase
VEQWLVAVGAGRWQLSGIKAAKTEGIRVLALDADRHALGFSAADRSELVDIRDPDAVLECVRSTGIIPSGAAAFVTDAGMRSAAAVREEYDLAGPRRNVVNRLTNKQQQRLRWSQAGLPSPRWYCLNSAEEAEQAIKTMDGSIIFKPTDSAGSRGVTVVEPSEDWRPAFDAAVAGSSAGQAMVEAFISGTEYTVETFAHQGRTAVLAVTEKKKVKGTRETVANELATPQLCRSVVNQIGELAVNALEALGYVEGPGHTEILRKEDGSLWLVEAAGRGGGFMVADGLVPRASGFDLARASALQAVGRETPAPEHLTGNAAVLRFLPSRRGIVTSMGGFDEARLIGNVECAPLVSIGDRVDHAKTDSGRLAYILCWADDVVQARQLADRAEACLSVDIAALPC